MKNVKFFQYSVLFLSFVLLFSCSKNKELTLEQAVGSYVTNEQSAVVFGSINLMSILNKAEYNKIPKFGMIASSYIKEVSTGLDLEKGIHFVLNGPFKKDGSPEEVLLFLKVKNIDTLKSMAMKQGYEVEEGNGFSYFRDNDVSLAMQGSMAVVLIKNGDFDEKDALAKIMTSAEKGDVKSDIEKLVAAKGDIHVVGSLENAYLTSDTDLSELSKEKKKEIEELVAGSFVESTTYFESGQIRMEAVNHFSEALNKRKVFLTDDQAQIRSKLGNGNPSIALSLNLDMRQAQAWIEDLTGGSIDKFTRKVGGPAEMLFAFSGGKIYNIINGKIGVAVYAEAKPMIGVTPDFNLYAGFGPNGMGLAKLAKSQMSSDDLQLVILDDGLMATSSKAPLGKINKMNVPQGCESFGKGGITLFANFEKMDMKSFELEGAGKLLNLAKYGSVYLDQKGGTVLLKLKDNKTNVLKQCGDFLLEEFASQIGGMTL
ncbi:MAG: hypothetical protein KJ941_06540 [Bacteroidetes bacterium]|nr:hypothetical protein [Bacteroidota bacterium]